MRMPLQLGLQVQALCFSYTQFAALTSVTTTILLLLAYYLHPDIIPVPPLLLVVLH